MGEELRVALDGCDERIKRAMAGPM